MMSLAFNPDIFEDELSESIHNYLRKKEREVKLLSCKANVLELRRSAVDFVAVMSEKTNVSKSSQHLAIALYDQFIDNTKVICSEVQLVLICCLTVACKFQETEDRVPTLKSLNSLASIEILSKEYMKMEQKILRKLDWKICIPTSHDFKDYYMKAILIQSDLQHIYLQSSSKEDAYKLLDKFMNYFLEVSLQNSEFIKLHKSMVTASCACALRVVLQMSPVWHSHLHRITRYTHQQLLPYVSILITLFNEDSQAEKNEQQQQAYSKHQPFQYSSGQTVHPASFDSVNSSANSDDLYNYIWS